MAADYYPRSPRGERRPPGCSHRTDSDFYPRSPRGERPAICNPAERGRAISIHAPREGSDPRPHFLQVFALISIHAPREGSDSWALWAGLLSRRFLSTLPARGATRGYLIHSVGALKISIHAPREGSDWMISPAPVCCWNFYPRSPRGERRQQAGMGTTQSHISIHAPREGSDVIHYRSDWLQAISIHAPREGSDTGK